MESSADMTAQIGQGEEPSLHHSSSKFSLISKFQNLVTGKVSNKVGDISEFHDFPPEVPTDSSSKLTPSDSLEFDEWLTSTNNFYIKPRRNVSQSVNLAGLRSFSCYDVCNAKNGVFFALTKTSIGQPIHDKNGVMSITDPVNYALVNQMGHAVMTISSTDDSGLDNKVEIIIKGTNRGYMKKCGIDSVSLCNQSDQLLFRFIWSGSVHVIIMGDKKHNKSEPIGEIGSSEEVYRLSIHTILPVPLIAMLLGACVALMHKRPNPNELCILKSPMAVVIFGLLAIVMLLFVIGFR